MQIIAHSKLRHFTFVKMYEEDKSAEWLMISKIDVDALEKCVKTKKSTVTVQNVGLKFYSWRNFYGLVAVAACAHAFGFLLIAITHFCYIGKDNIQKFVKNEC